MSRVRVENSFVAESVETNTLGVQRSRSGVSVRRYIVQIGLLAALYYFAARLGFILELPRTNISPAWPPSGIGFAAMLLFGRRVWPGIAIGAFLANLLTLPNTLVGFVAASVICVGNTLEHVVALQFIRQFVPLSSPFDRVRDVFWFVVTACVACTIASTFGTAALHLAGIVSTERIALAWFTWWLGDTAGMLVLTPAIFSWWRTPRLGLKAARKFELAVLVTATVLAAELLFGGWIASEIISSLPYLVVPSLLWAAIRFGLRETSTLAVLLSVIAVSYVWWWMGGPAARNGPATVFAPFLVPAFSPNNSLLALQVFVCAVAVTGVTLAAAVNERKMAEAALRQGEERLLLAQQAAHIGTFEWNIQTDVNTWTPEMELMHGLKPGEFGKTQQAWQRLLHPDDLDPTLRCVEQAFQTGMPTEGEWRIVWPDGSVRWIAARFQVFKDAAGRPLRLTGINIDITERKLADERLRLVFEAAPHGMVIINPQGEILLANAQMETLFGYSSHELLGKSIEMLVPERYRSQHPHHRSKFFAAPLTRMMGAGRHLFGRRKDGHEIPVEIGLNPINTDAGLLVLASVIDITQRKLAEAQLKSTLDQLQGLAVHLETVREEERTRIARELHDELGQALTGLKLELAWIKGRLIKESRQEQLPLLLGKAEEMSKQIDTTIQSMRRIVTELRPGILDEFGLSAALEWQGQEFHKRTGIPCSVSVTDTSVSAERSSALFRIVQEALTNVARHANATSVEIRLQQDSDGLSLTIEDNGKGITDEMIVSGRSFGLLGMRERAAAIGGTFELVSPLGAGTRIVVRIPSPRHFDSFPMTKPASPVEVSL